MSVICSWQSFASHIDDVTIDDVAMFFFFITVRFFVTGVLSESDIDGDEVDDMFLFTLE